MSLTVFHVSLFLPCRQLYIKKRKPKADLEGDDDDGGPDIDWVALAASGGVAKQTVPNLKAFLKSKGLPVGGKKADLVERALSVLSE